MVPPEGAGRRQRTGRATGWSGRSRAARVGRVNVLFVTLDQFRADCLSVAGHPVVSTPNLDRLAASGVRFGSHHGQAAPCAPGRASLYTGMYQMNHRVAANGSPLEDRFDNVARLARRAGYEPALFGYTDQGVDPSVVTDPSDPRLDTYEGVLPGFDPALHLDGHMVAWLDWLESLGYGTLKAVRALRTEPERPAEHSASAFLTDRLLDWIDHRDGPWFAHASYLRPHPPYAAAGHWSTRYGRDEVGEPLATDPGIHPLVDMARTLPVCAAPADPGEMAHLRSQYFGMVSEVDDQFGRLLDHLEATEQDRDTLVIVTADHGEQLGDHGLIQKLGFYESSYAIPCIVRAPGRSGAAGQVVDAFTEAVDILPTVAELLGQEAPLQCDGASLVPFLDGSPPSRWRSATHWEYDWRDMAMGEHRTSGGADPRLERANLAVERTSTHAYVQFADGSWLCFDLAADPGWRTTTEDPAVVLPLAQSMLIWRSTHLGGNCTQLLLGPERRGLWPARHPA
jgi:arylsulfatase A-like enzyme